MARIKTIEIVDIENVRTEKLRYQKNSLSYGLGFGGIVLSVFAAFIALNTLKPTSTVILKIFLNIIILLVGFLSCENVKNYRKGYSFVFFGFAVVNVLRIFWFPMRFINAQVKIDSLNKKVTALTEEYNEAVEAGNIVESKEILDKINAQKEKITSKQKTFSPQVFGDANENNKGFLPKNGSFRGVLCIVLLLASAALFALSGFFGFVKARKLEKYLTSIGVDIKKR